MVMTAAQLAGLTAPYLRHSCTLRRAGAPTGFDEYQEPVAGAAADTTGVACWCAELTAAGETEEPARALVATGWRVLLPAGTAVTEADSLLDVRDEAGATIVAGPLDIAQILRPRGHLTALCTEAGRVGVTP